MSLPWISFNSSIFFFVIADREKKYIKGERRGKKKKLSNNLTMIITFFGWKLTIFFWRRNRDVEEGLEKFADMLVAILFCPYVDTFSIRVITIFIVIN